MRVPPAPRPPARLLRRALAGLAALLGLLVGTARPAAAQAPCGTPGKDGPGGTLAGVVNTYWPGTGTASAGATSLTVGGALAGGATTPVTAGDLLLVIQMQDATLDTRNNARYGSGGGTGSGATSYNTAGQYEYVVATGSLGTGGGTVGVRGANGGGLVNSYASTAGTAAPRRRFQVVRVPQYASAAFSSGLTAAPWTDGLAGGVLAVDVAGRLTLGGTVSVDGKGFRGGAGRQLGGGPGGANTDYATGSANAFHGGKGEGVAGTPQYVVDGAAPGLVNLGADALPGGGMAMGAPGNAGGGGTDGNPAANDQNTGGGGGAGAGAGGQGGRGWSSRADAGGRGGAAFPAAAARLVLGGGGGAGTTNNGTGALGAGLSSSGAPGGGIVLVRAGTVAGSGVISAGGANADNSVTNDGSGGGGGGGSVLVTAASGGVGGLTVRARGGAGGSNSGGGTAHGPGGGGGGGYVATTGGASVDVAGGAAGTTAADATYGTAFGATPGAGGVATTVTAAQVPGAQASAACVAALTVGKTTSTAAVTAGTTATYTITVDNAAGRDSARQVAVLDTLPAGMRFGAAGAVTLTGGALRAAASTPAAGDSVAAFGTFTIPGGGRVSITFTVTVAYTAAPGTRQNSATALYLDPARTTAAGTAAAQYAGTSGPGEDVAVTGVPDLRLAKTHAGDFVVNRPGAYTLAVTNAGTAATSAAVTVTDTLPAGLAYTGAAGAGWTCAASAPAAGAQAASAHVVTCTLAGAVAGGGAAAPALTLTVTPTSAAAASVTNTARAGGGGEPAALAADNAASDPTAVTRIDLALALTDSARTFVVGQPGYYTLTVTNAGTAATAGASTVSATLPAGLTFAGGSGAGWTCAATSPQVATCTRADTLAAGAAWPAVRVQVAVAAAAVPSVTATAGVATPYDAAAPNNSAGEPTPVVTVGVSVTPDGGVVERLPSNGVQYAQAFTVTNTGSAGDTFTLAAGLAPGAAVTVVSTNGQAGAAGGAVTLGAGASATVTVVYTVAAGAAAGATDSVRLTAASGTAAGVADPGYAVVRVVRAQLQLAKQAYRDDRATPIAPTAAVLPGEYVQYKITVSSVGTAGAVTVRVVDPLPPQLALAAAVPDGAGWTLSTAGGTLTAELAGALPVGQSRHFWLRARVQ